MLGKTWNQNLTLGPADAEPFFQEGWKKADLHMHSSCSYDVPPAKSMHPSFLFEKAKKKGFDFITFTDHDTVKAFDLLGWDLERAVSGVEIAIRDPERVGHTLHVNVFDLDADEFLELETIANQEQNFKSFTRYLRVRDLPHVYNHPFWFAPGDLPNLKAVPELIKQFQVVEYNVQDLLEINMITVALARKYRKGIVATTDSHTGNIGDVYTLAQGESFREFFDNIKKGKSYMVVEGGTRRHLTTELDTWIELVFSMDKQGMEDVNFTTNSKVCDRLIDLLSSEKFREFPRLNHTTMKLFQNLTRSGIPAYIYMRTEKPLVSKIKEVVDVTV